MLWLPAGAPVREYRSLYDEEIAPHKDKIVWYRLKKLPEITPDASAPVRNSGANRRNKDFISSRIPNAPQSPQLVWTDAPHPEPRKFVAPDMISIRRRTATVNNAPQLAPEAAGQLKPARLELPKLAPKPFVAPGAAPAPPRDIRQLALSDAPALDAAKPIGGDPALAALKAATGVKAPKPFTAPDAAKQGARAGSGAVREIADAPGLAPSGSAEVNALVLNTLHTALPGNFPALSNMRISAGPKTGTDSPGGGPGLQIPGVVVQPGDPPSVRDTPPSAPTSQPPYVATSVAPLQQTFSAPLAPSSRFLPAVVEARFHQRVVYTVVLPMRKAPGYSADWIMWFAEHQPDNGAGSLSQVRAPLPVRKLIRANSASEQLPARIELTATIDRNGRLSEISAIPSGAASAHAVAAAIEDLKSWEFLPALRNRVAIDVDIILDISFGGMKSGLLSHTSIGTAGN